MYLFVLCIFSCLSLCLGATTTTATTTTTTTPPPFDCYEHTCYERGCLARDITNATNYPGWITNCTTADGTAFCAVHINASANYHEVRATCEQTCTISGNRDSGTATWCCQTELCNDDENNLPVPNNNEASHLAGKLVALLLTGTMLLVSSSL